MKRINSIKSANDMLMNLLEINSRITSGTPRNADFKFIDQCRKVLKDNSKVLESN